MKRRPMKPWLGWATTGAGETGGFVYQNRQSADLRRLVDERLVRVEVREVPKNRKAIVQREDGRGLRP